MEAINMKIFVVAVMMIIMAISAVKGVAAADAPAPAPASDATVFVPAVISSFVALAFALFF
ncbi:arabinogalactan protein 13-like [Solanum pennellii]|uniref:Arabinogalactan protein 13-like n=1 Tax=Solanum pennellii TaxID=28526 RepID=A0ABM1V6M5_SOLPN|nr:arabinogalactan protein 13-like [Solanum pennellii]